MDYSKIKNIDQIDVNGKRVLIRVDFNVPVKGGVVTNDLRIRAALPTIESLLKRGGRLILVSHLGRPKGKIDAQYSMKPVQEALAKLVSVPVHFCETIESLKGASESLKPGEILLFENIRFYAGEEKNDPDLSAKLAEAGDVYVNDAFGTAHRAHASTEGVARLLRPAVCGYLMKKELDFLGKAVSHPEKPYVAIIGGAKISGKIDVIENLASKVDHLLIGGAMMFTFNKAKGLPTGKSLVEEDRVEMAKDLLARFGKTILLPTDCMVSTSFDFEKMTVGPLKSVAVDALGSDDIGLDIGPETIARYRDLLLSARTVVWNGPMGVFEVDSTAKGTFALADALAEATSKGATTVIGGGDSAAAVEKAGLADRVSHVSTGGGASLEFLEGKELPGVAALDRN
ncbi:MAG: phosphoglycerate kinase [Leptonema illini]|uniref:Phosphoglycerate kinase n=1 Tax=Leptonema illini TaxID=183 RepID=A0A833H3P9_9LEPT|nr:MAG: phosphoglycerate kinase [Leptonema illini]